MEEVNIDVLEIILSYLPYQDIFSINILSKNIHHLFTHIEFNSKQINTNHVNILKKYSFRNIKIKILKIFLISN
mgnify:CR=1 FL=1